MGQILGWLSGGDLRSDGMANEAADFVLKNPELFEELFEGLSVSDDVVRGRTADALEKISRKRPDMLVDRLPKLQQVAEEDHVPMVKMHLAMIFGHLAMYEERLRELISTLLHLLDDGSVFTRSWAVVSLCIMGRMYPEEREQILERIQPIQRDQSIAMRTKARKAVDLLTNKNITFPKGWIKSEHLQGYGGGKLNPYRMDRT
jgi:HEAT repeat protein